MSSADEWADSAVRRYFVDDPEARDGERLIIRGATARRLNRVMRVRRGDLIEVVHAPDERVYELRITRVARETVEGEIAGSRAAAAPAPPRITICPALIRPQRFDFMVEKVTELGAAAIQPVWTERSIIRTEGAQRLARWRRLVTEASEQCGRETRPQVHPPRDLPSLLAQPPAGALRILASTAKPHARVADLFRDAALPQEVYILVGPEGGLSPAEAQLAQSHGWRPTTLAPRPLRAETAAIAALALVADAIAARPPNTPPTQGEMSQRDRGGRPAP